MTMCRTSHSLLEILSVLENMRMARTPLFSPARIILTRISQSTLREMFTLCIEQAHMALLIQPTPQVRGNIPHLTKQKGTLMFGLRWTAMITRM